ncbi:MAG: hypothetical protein IMY72_09025 [Bacteroidetes bacterium]|nr:hypothetical protein [Bacteroidota bacterium]
MKNNYSLKLTGNVLLKSVSIILLILSIYLTTRTIVPVNRLLLYAAFVIYSLSDTIMIKKMKKKIKLLEKQLKDTNEDNEG